MMPDINEVFKSIEAFEMKTEWLTSSKLGKVLKQVGALDNSKVPLDEKYNIRARARALEEKWRRTLGIEDEFASRVVTTAPVTDVKSGTKTLANGGQENKENTQPAQVSAENSMAVVSNKDEKKDDDTEAKDQEKGDVKAAEGKSDKDEIKEDGKKMDCSDSTQPKTTKAEEFYQLLSAKELKRCEWNSDD
ncbi:hypothetical protein PPACK8108_LOCUS10346 [Phakopsora pachyrhizi]|uniref:TFIIS N-terminal domain-containing protein n=1 Tax=Phakopsora pachyrhizi TaxID=170000 RepID=A0AAV0B0T2_PHAPC|nr:hypothetical protein PPACK8108_LOCUS10346 [Phakopsora pachyrhizi]